MSFIEQFNHLLKDLGNNIGLPDLQASGEGFCSLRFDDKITIDLESHEESGVLTFSSIVGTLSEHEADAFYPQLLEANLLWGGTGGATLALEKATLNVFLCYQEHLEGMDFLRFQQLLKGFSDTALFWHQRLQQRPETNVTPSSTESSGESTTATPSPEETPVPATVLPGMLA
ncbi:MAG: type III secretion system chaperone [Chthoniobacterales bacterium]|nr:type III secretion system chaperone [Chthoniobacterales bacterium]